MSTHIDTDGIRKILIKAAGAILAGLVLQSLMFIWWAGSMDARMGYVEKCLDSVNQRVHALEVE